MGLCRCRISRGKATNRVEHAQGKHRFAWTPAVTPRRAQHRFRPEAQYGRWYARGTRPGIRDGSIVWSWWWGVVRGACGGFPGGFSMRCVCVAGCGCRSVHGPASSEQTLLRIVWCHLLGRWRCRVGVSVPRPCGDGLGCLRCCVTTVLVRPGSPAARYGHHRGRDCARGTGDRRTSPGRRAVPLRGTLPSRSASQCHDAPTSELPRPCGAGASNSCATSPMQRVPAQQ